jgi:hypothetical protein
MLTSQSPNLQIKHRVVNREPAKRGPCDDEHGPNSRSIQRKGRW